MLSSKKKRCSRVHKVCRAVPPGNDNDNGSLQLPVVPFVTSPVYLAAQAAVVVGLSAAIDAGWSGDWSRIEVITTDDEATVRNVVQQVLTFHLVCTPVAFLAAKAKGNDTTKATLKTLLIGGLACFEAVLSPPEE